MAMQMDVDGESCEALAEMDDLEKYGFENENCGICRDIVIDRGVLDCCQHWFCFTCIDNWAAITNRCPLCKSEFQRITCSPVYDTTATINEDVYSLASGDDDWYVQGENNTLSFPSYYINADAVVCLDNGGCKIRGGLAAAEDDSTFDTSIACDSCDIWYHATCVGFNPEQTTQESWLCPRCMSTEVKHTMDAILKQNFSEDCNVTGSDRVLTDASFSGRVSVSVADEGETALVVSMVGGHSEISGNLSEASPSLKTGQDTLHCASYPKFDFSHDTVSDATVLGNTDYFSRSCKKSSEMNLVCPDFFEPTKRPMEFSPIHESVSTLATSHQGNMSNEQLESPQHVSSYWLLQNGNDAENTVDESNVVSKNNDETPFVKSPVPSSPGILDIIQQEGKEGAQDMQLLPINAEHKSSALEEVEDMETGNEVDYPVKKAKWEMTTQEIHLAGYSVVSPTNHPSASGAEKAIADDMLEFVPQDKSVPDIMSIVDGNDYRMDPGRELAKPVGRKAGDKSGLRVKKIMRRKEEEKGSSVLVQKLQREIREVVRDSGTSISEKDDSFDEKLLSAFRAAIGKPVDVPAKKVDPSLIRTRRSLLQKGKIRENLTKKLYGSSTGRRRSAWHRDWEVEFWKYRCSPGIKPEKIETLQSVLQLLKKSSNTNLEKETALEEKGDSTNTILSRVYLADASVVPRKDGIKPLSALAGCSTLDNNGQNKTDNCSSPNKAAPEVGTIKVTLSDGTGKFSSSSIQHKEAAIGRENRTAARSSKVQDSQNQQNQSASNVKHDKRKWALEVLARKNASSIAGKDKTEDGDVPKGNYPLLAQLPKDMRPLLATSCHNKVPVSVRQAQLYRVTEHYLQKANLDVIRRCADTELAIADAVNVEKEIFEKSHSKSVYVNLCSQATHQHAIAKSKNASSTPTEKIELGSDLVPQETTTEQSDVGGRNMEKALSNLVPEETTSKHTVVEEVLRRAGLLDSPPNSPERKNTMVDGNSRPITNSLQCSQRKDPHTQDTLPMEAGDGNSKCVIDVDSQLDKWESLQSDSVDGCSVGCPDITNTSKSLKLTTTTITTTTTRLLVPKSLKPESENSNSRVWDIFSPRDEESTMLIDSNDVKHRSPKIAESSSDSDKLTGLRLKSTSQEHMELVPSVETTDATANETSAAKATEADMCNVECEESSRPDMEILVDSVPDDASKPASSSTEMEVANSNLHNSQHGKSMPIEGKVADKPKNRLSAEDGSASNKSPLNSKHPIGDKPSNHPNRSADDSKNVVSNSVDNNVNSSSSIYKKVELFVKENIRPFCKSGVITVEQYRWAVAKTTDKVMKYHCDAKNANFLIKESDKVKKLALQYVEAAQQKVS